MIYVAVDGDDVGRRLAACYLSNRADFLKETKDLIDDKTQIISNLLSRMGFEVLFCAADGVTGALEVDFIDEDALYKSIEGAIGYELTFSAGVGQTLREAYIALLFAKSTGKGRICNFRTISLDV